MKPEDNGFIKLGDLSDYMNVENIQLRKLEYFLREMNDFNFHRIEKEARTRYHIIFNGNCPDLRIYSNDCSLNILIKIYPDVGNERPVYFKGDVKYINEAKNLLKTIGKKLK